MVPICPFQFIKYMLVAGSCPALGQGWFCTWELFAMVNTSDVNMHYCLSVLASSHISAIAVHREMNNKKNKNRLQLQSWCNPLLFAQLQSWDIHIFVVNIWIWISKWNLENATLLTNIIENISTNLSKPNSWADVNNVLLKANLVPSYNDFRNV